VKREPVICGFWLLLSLYSSIESYRLGLSAANRPGPGFFPLIAAAGIGVIAALRLIGSARAGVSAENSHFDIGGEAKLVLYVIAGMTAYAFLLEPFGRNTAPAVALAALHSASCCGTRYRPRCQPPNESRRRQGHCVPPR